MMRQLTAVIVAVAAFSSGCKLLEPPPPPNDKFHSLEVKYVEADGVRLAYVEAGSGRDVILIHGLFSSKYTFRKNIFKLAEQFHVVAIDCPGSGASDKPPNIDYSPEGMARFILRAMDQLGIKKTDLVGNSLGGAIALAIARDHPDRVDKLVLIDAAGYPSPTLNLPMETAPFLGEFLSIWYGDVLVGLTWRQAVYDYDTMTEEDRLAMARPMRPLAGKNALLQKMRAIQGGYFDRFSRTFGSIRTPTLVIWGQNDQIIPVADAYKFLADLPKSYLLVVGRCGHRAQFEAPDVVNTGLVRFLTSDAFEAAENRSGE